MIPKGAHTITRLLLPATTAAAVCLMAAAAEPRVIRVQAQASVPSARVRLGDVAVVMGAPHTERSRVEDMVVTTIPPGSRRIQLKLADIRTRLAAGGLNLADWQVKGATRCRVICPAGPRTATAAPRNDGGQAGSLEEKLYEYVAKQFGLKPDELELRFLKTGKEVLGLAGPAYQFRIGPRRIRGLQNISLMVEVLDGGKPVRTVPMMIEARIRRKVVVAARTINKGETIEAGAVRLEERLFERLRSSAMQDLRAVIDQQARKMIEAGAVVDAGAIRPVTLVRRNRFVYLIFRKGNLEITDSGTATQDGTFGETVMVRKGRRSGQLIAAKVIGKSTVELLGTGATSPLAKAE